MINLQGSLMRHREKLTSMLCFILNLLVLDGLLALFGATLRGPGIINPNFYEVWGGCNPKKTEKNQSQI